MLLHTDSYRKFLSEELTRRLHANPRYSQRAFARQLGLSAGELSEILRGKRGLSLKSALRIAQALSLSPAETKHLLYLTQSARLTESEEVQSLDAVDRGTQQLTLDMFHVVSDWYCFGILNLADCDDFRSDISWIAKRLGISKIEVQVALERLERVGLVERKKGRIHVTKDYVIAPSGIPSEAVRNNHKQILKKAADALDFQEVGEREISGIGMAIDPKNIGAIKKDISEFLDHLVAKYSKGKKKEVYQLEVAFFKLTQGGSYED